MPSMALQIWTNELSGDLDEIENAHRAVGGTGPGRRTATLQINQAYAVLLSGHFQAFCRELHLECAAYLVAPMPDLRLRSLYRSSFLLDRKLDRGNPSPGNIGSDFGRFDLAFWAMVGAHRTQNARRKSLLQELTEWRNAIAHQDFSPAMLRGSRPILGLAQVQLWRNACDGLTRSMDSVMGNHIRALTGTRPW